LTDHQLVYKNRSTHIKHR